MEREFYSIPEAAARLGISRIAVFKRVKKGRLEALRFGRNWAVSASALELAVLAAAAPAKVTPPARPVLPARAKKKAGAVPPPVSGEDLDSSLL
ncbi:MAG: excisionase family DNA-binding protein [Elusimicrobiales bacterium]|nr:excisionase family DNA-binding protein [Elusimicrobiales bacterium]